MSHPSQLFVLNTRTHTFIKTASAFYYFVNIYTCYKAVKKNEQQTSETLLSFIIPTLMIAQAQLADFLALVHQTVSATLQEKLQYT